MRELFHVEPPKSQDVQSWIDWMERDKRAESSAKRKATMTLEHGDVSESFLGAIGFGFEGDFSEGTGEIVATVSYRHNVGKRRGRRGGKRRHRRGRR